MGSAGRPGRPSGVAAADRSFPAAATSSADADDVEWKVLASLLLLGLVSWTEPLDRQQRQAEVANLGEQAVQGRLVGDRPGDQGLAGRIAADLEAVEPAGPVTVEVAVHTELVVGRSIGIGRPRSSWRSAHRVSRATAASRTPTPEDPSAHSAYRWADRA